MIVLMSEDYFNEILKSPKDLVREYKQYNSVFGYTIYIMSANFHYEVVARN